MIVSIVSKSYESEATLTEPVYGTRYSRVQFAPDFMDVRCQTRFIVSRLIEVGWRPATLDAVLASPQPLCAL